jgi:hypothetical protein
VVIGSAKCRWSVVRFEAGEAATRAVLRSSIVGTCGGRWCCAEIAGDGSVGDADSRWLASLPLDQLR